MFVIFIQIIYISIPRRDLTTSQQTYSCIAVHTNTATTFLPLVNHQKCFSRCKLLICICNCLIAYGCSSDYFLLTRGDTFECINIL